MGTDNLVARLAEIDGAKDAELDRIAAKLAGLRDERVARLERIRDDREAAIAALQAQIDQIRGAAMDAIEAENTAWTEVERKAAQQRERKLAEFAGQRETFASQLAAIEAAQSQRARHAQTRETIRQMREEAEGLQRDATGQTAAIDKLDAYKSELLANLPIPGLEVRDGAILRNEIPFDRLNTAQQVEIAVEIAKLRAGKLAVACVDGIELLDAGHYETFRQQAIESGLQLFVTRVSDGEFQVTSDASR
jgi:chromosome segregation ATPase